MTKTIERPANEPAKAIGRTFVFVLLIGIPALYLALQHSGLLSADASVLMPYVVWLVVSLLAGWRSFVTAGRATQRAVRVAWLWLGWGAVAWSVGIVLELVSLRWTDSLEIIVGARRLLYLAYPIMLVAGLFTLASSTSRSLGLLNLANIGVIGSSMLICAILVLLEPVIQSEESASYVLFSIADLTTLFTATIVALHLLWMQESPAFRAVVLLLAWSTTVHAAANIGYYLDEFQLGGYDGDLDIVWHVAFLLHFWAAYEQDALGQKATGRAARTDWIERSADTVQVLLPAALIILCVVVALIFAEQLSNSVIRLSLIPMTLFAIFLGLREWALEHYREQLVEKLYESNELNTHVLRSSPGVVAICEATPGYAVTYISENGRLLFGIDAENFDFKKHIHPADQQIARNSLQRTLAHGTSTCEVRILDQAGEWRWVDQRFVLRHDADGNPTELIGTLMDITDRKKLQLSLEQTQRLESLGRLSGSIAHDFNNLLTAILGFSELLLDERTLNDADRERVTEIKEAAERGASLTQQLLTFSRRHAVSTEVIDINALIANMQEMLWRLLADEVELEYRLAADPLNVEGNKNQLEQVLLNLVLNASEAMPDGGRIVVATSVSDEAAGIGEDAGIGTRSALISVSDEGIGIDESIRSQIFDPFFTTKSEGTGLGLATVHGIVRQHGGHIDVRNRPEGGTRIEILLPVTTRKQATSRAAAAPSVQRGKEHLLVIDDETAITRVLASALSPMGYTVHTANSPDEAIRIAHEHPFHLVLSDMIMPECNGYELVSRLRDIQDGFRVIYMSGYTDDVLARQHLREEDTPLLQKPLKISELAAEIRRQLDDN